MALDLSPCSLETHDDLEATNIQLAKTKLLAQNGDYPRWSPDGKKILYSILTPQGPEVWQMNSDGSEKKFVVSGVNGNWSLDGDKIVFFSKRSWSKYSISIYDLRQKKVLYQDNDEFDLNGPGILKGEFDPEMIHWYQNKIYVISSLGLGFSVPPMKGVSILDLDTLKWQSSNERDYRRLINELNRNNKLPNLNIEQVPLYVIPHRALGKHYYWGPLEVPNFLRGIWAVSKSQEFSIKLLDNATQPELSPTLNELVFVRLIYEQANTYRTEIHCCELKKSGETTRTLYEVELGTKNGVKEGDSLIVAEPKINPLNNKIIGYSEVPKAIVTVSGTKEDTCHIFPNIIIQAFGIGDIAAYEDKEVFGPIIREISELELFPEEKPAFLEIDKLREEIKELQIVLANLENRTPQKKEIDVIFRKIQKTADESHLDITKFSPKGEVDSGYCSEWPTIMEVAGSYDSLHSFFDKMSKFEKIINIDDMSIKPAISQGPDRKLIATFILKMYLFLEKSKQYLEKREEKKEELDQMSKLTGTLLDNLKYQKKIYEKKIDLIKKQAEKQEGILRSFENAILR